MQWCLHLLHEHVKVPGSVFQLGLSEKLSERPAQVDTFPCFFQVDILCLRRCIIDRVTGITTFHQMGLNLHSLGLLGAAEGDSTNGIGARKPTHLLVEILQCLPVFERAQLLRHQSLARHILAERVRHIPPRAREARLCLPQTCRGQQRDTIMKS